MRHYTDACRVEKIRTLSHKLFLRSDDEPANPIDDDPGRPIAPHYTPCPGQKDESGKYIWHEDTVNPGRWERIPRETCSAGDNAGRGLSLCGDYDGPEPSEREPERDTCGRIIERSPFDNTYVPPSNTGEERGSDGRVWIEENTCGGGHWENPGSTCSSKTSVPYMRFSDKTRAQAISAMRRFKELSIENVLAIGHIINPRESSQIRGHKVFLSHGKKIDEFVVFPDEHRVASRLAELCRYVNDNPDRLDRVELAAAFAYGFCMVHPFADGNGRTSRVLTNYFLKPGESFRQLPTERMDYRKACLQINMTGDLDAMYRFFQARLQ